MPPTPAALVADLEAGLDALRLEQGAGLVVTVGFGLGGEAALLAAAQARRVGRDTADGEPGFSAGVALDGAGARFAAGAPPPAHEGFARRAARLCAMLAQGGAAGAVERADCLAALVPSAVVADAVPERAVRPSGDAVAARR